MIYEYAIQPEVLIEWAKDRRDFKLFKRNFGLGTARIVSTFPAQQARKLRSYLLRMLPSEIDGLDATRYEAIIEITVECLAERQLSSKDISLNEWARLVVAEDQVKPFGIVLSKSNLNVVRNLTPDGIYEFDELWEHPRQVPVNRTNLSVYTGLKGLLELSRQKIIIADPYGYKSGAINFIGFMLNELSKVIEVEFYPEIELYFDEKSARAEHVKGEILKLLDFEFCDTKLKVKGIPKFHNRYIFTEHGGVSLGHGLSLSGDHTQDDEITLLDKKVYEQRLKDFSG